MNKLIVLLISIFIIFLLFVINAIQLQGHLLVIDFIPQFSNLSFHNIIFDIGIFFIIIIGYFIAVYSGGSD